MFVVQSLPRCGTHLVRTALESHGGINCYGEVFNPSSRTHGFPINRPSISEVITHCQSCLAPSGFVAHAYVGLSDDERGPGLDQPFRQRKDVDTATGLWRAVPPQTNVVTLYRENLLERYVSLLIAEKRGNWLVYSGYPLPPPVTVCIDCSKMVSDFVLIETLMSIARHRFPDAVLVSYEQLVSDSKATFDHLQSHIGVAIEHLRPRTLKVGRPLHESISNFDEVRSVLLGTRYEIFLKHAS